ncbi:MAG: hypothetical protein LBI26_03130 [Holosporales bacterium]|nr:hypothetical protein [Holosporales bacterium]
MKMNGILLAMSFATVISGVVNVHASKDICEAAEFTTVTQQQKNTTVPSGFYIVGSAGYGVTLVKCESKVKAGTVMGKKTAVVAGFDETAKNVMAKNEKIEKFLKVKEYWTSYYMPLGTDGGPAKNVAGNLTGIDWKYGGGGANIGEGGIPFVAAPVGNAGVGAVAKVKNLFGKVAKEVTDALGDGYKIYAGNQLLSESGIEIGFDIPGVGPQQNYLIFTTPVAIEIPGKGKITLFNLDQLVIGVTVNGNVTSDAASKNRYLSFMAALEQLVNSPALNAALKDKLTLDQNPVNPSAVENTTEEVEQLAEIKAATETFSQGKNRMNFGLAIGGQRVVGSGFYVALEAGSVFVSDEVEVATKDKSKRDTYFVGANTTTYDTTVNSSKPKIVLSEKYSFHATPALGYAKDSFVFYIPVMFKMTKYEMSFTPGVTGKSYEGDTYLNLAEEENSIDVYATETSLVAASGKTPTKTTTTQKKTQNKISFEVGAGVRFMVGKKGFIGVRYMFSPEADLKFTTAAYKSPYIHDQYQTGADHKVKVSSHRGTLEFGVVF